MCFTELIGQVKEWQTIISALIALMAAGCTIYVMMKQMRIDKKRLDSAAERKKLAVRAQLPDALSEMSSHIATTVGQILDDNHTKLLPPIAALATLKNAIEYVDSDAAEQIFTLVSWCQVWNARLPADSREAEREFATIMHDSARLLFYTNSLFSYARNESEVVSLEVPTQESMMGALRSVVGISRFLNDERRFSGAVDLIRRRYRTET